MATQTFKPHRGTFDRPVEVSPTEKYTITARIPRDEDFRKPLADNDLIQGWAGFSDTETGEPLEFGPENLTQVMADLPIQGAVWRALGQLQADALSGALLAGNSGAPSSTS